MVRARLVVAVLFLIASTGLAQQSASSTATCNLEDGRQVYIRYLPVPTKNDKVPNGKPWAPGGVAMTLFTEVPLSFGGVTLPIGAYSLYPIPAKEKWTIAINRNVTAGAPYDEKQDVVRAAVETDQISQPSDALEVAFAHYGPKCTLRIYFGKAASFADFISH